MGVCAVYLLLRLGVWHRTVLLEDHDSLGYLREVDVIRSLSFQLLTPDSQPFYPMLTALLGFLPINDLDAARLCSLLMSLLLIAAVWALGRRLSSAGAASIGVLFLAVSPLWVPLSVSVLAEPTYVALVYTGLWVFLLRFRNPTLTVAALLGAVFAIAFWTRVEGLLFLGLVPLLQVGAILEARQLREQWNEVSRWALTYVAVFLIVAAPQVIRVSSQMGEFAINGRQVWSAIISQPDGRSSEEKLYALDYSPTEFNLYFLQSRAEARRGLSAGLAPSLYLKRAVRTFDEIMRVRIGTVVGPIYFALFLFGIVALYRGGRRFEVGAIFAFLGSGLLGPLLQEPMLNRHLSVLVPIVLLIAGVGVVELSSRLTRTRRHRPRLQLALVLLALLTVAIPLREAFSPPLANWEYSPARLEGPLRALSAEEAATGSAAPRIVTRRGYLPYFAGGTAIWVPYADFPSLVRYMSAHHSDYLYLEHKQVRERPFLAAFQEPTPPEGFQLLYRGTEETGDLIELYRFTPPHSAAIEEAPYFAPWNTSRQFYD